VCPIWEERGRAAEGEVPKAIIPQEIAELDKKYKKLSPYFHF
jgi:hypothetical protein